MKNLKISKKLKMVVIGDIMVLNVPVLFLIFNRLDTTKQVFEEIRKAKPKKLYVAADGPRNKLEKKKTDEVRKYVLGNVDWDCDVKTLFRKKNLGCGLAVSGAIDWFFDNVEMGIILEDDCLPNQSFFPFCEELLKKYKNNTSVGMISGSNKLGVVDINESYFFSNYYHIWGWATWRRAWEKYDFDLKLLQKYSRQEIDIYFKRLFPNLFYKEYRKDFFYLVKNGLIDTWDSQLAISFAISNLLCIVPKNNLISNIGFNGTHMIVPKNKIFIESNNITKIIHPKKIVVFQEYENYIYNFILSKIFFKSKLLKLFNFFLK